jgi:ABC-type molybdate transport system substrate-binding protein
MTRRKKSTRKKWLIVLLTATILVALVVMALLNQQSTTVYSASEYFTFTDISALGKSLTQNNSTIRIEFLSFEITPFKGNAHHVVIFASGMTDPLNYAYDEILNGTKKSIEIQFAYGITCKRQGAGYSVNVRIQSDEATGQITLLILANNTFLD